MNGGADGELSVEFILYSRDGRGRQRSVTEPIGETHQVGLLSAAK